MGQEICLSDSVPRDSDALDHKQLPLLRTGCQPQPRDKDLELSPGARERNPLTSLGAQSQSGVSHKTD